MSKFIKNNTGSASTYVGQQIAAGAYYEIQAVELVAWQSNSPLLTAIATGDAIVAKDDTGSEDITDVNAALVYLKNLPGPVDTDGVSLSRSKITRSGWHFQLYGIEYQTSQLDSVHIQNAYGATFDHATVKFYDENDVELTTQLAVTSDCVKTVLDWEPPWDYELIGGQFRQLSVPSQDLYLGVMAAPDIPAEYGGSVPFVNGINLRFIGTEDSIRSDGRTSKLLVYDNVNHTNKIRFIINHSSGFQHRINFCMEIFRA